VRKVLSQEAVFVGSRGAGVQAGEISRITDQFLLAEVRRQASVVGRTEILGRYHDLLQDAFAPGDIGRAVAEINGELQAVHHLNAEIERLAHLGQVGPELLDRRDALIRSLAEKIDIRTFVQEDDRIAIYTADGETLLDALPRVLAYNPAATVAHDTPFDRIAIFRKDQIDPASGRRGRPRRAHPGWS
jgi:flagellar hook-associated protein FlgK